MSNRLFQHSRRCHVAGEPPCEVAAHRIELGRGYIARARQVDPDIAFDPPRSGAHHQHAVGEQRRFLDRVGDEDDGHAGARPDLEQLMLQLLAFAGSRPAMTTERTNVVGNALIRSRPDIAARDRHVSNAARLGRHHISIRNADGRIAHSVAGRAGFRQRIIDRYDRRPSVGNVEATLGITSELALTRDVRPVPEAELGFHVHRSHKPRLSDGTDKRGLSQKGQRRCTQARKQRRRAGADGGTSADADARAPGKRIGRRKRDGAYEQCGEH